MWRKVLSEIFTRYIFIFDILIIAIFAAFIAGAVNQIVAFKVDSFISKLVEKKTSSKSINSRVSSLYSKDSGENEFIPVDGKTILARNFFDSQAGPLDIDENERLKQNIGLQNSEIESPSAVINKCNLQLKVVGLFASDDPEWSFAAVDSGGKTQILKIGDSIQGHVLKDLSWKYAILDSQGTGSLCYLDIWQEEIQGGIKPPVTAIGGNLPPGRIGPPPPSTDRTDFETLMQNSITDVSETEKNIDRSLIDYVLQNKGSLMQSGRVLPNIENEEVKGFKVFGIRKTSLWGKLGIQNGDIINSVNGIEFKGPESAMDAFDKLQNAGHITVNITRRGKSMNLDYNIK